MLAMSLSAHDPTETWAARLLQRKSIVRSFAKALSLLYCMHTTSGGRGRMAIDIRRRELVVALGGAMAAWPLAVRAQQPSLPVVGLLIAGTQEAFAHVVPAFRRGLKEAGFAEGENVAIEYRWANNDADQLSALAADLVRRRVTVIVTPVTSTAALAAKAATTTIPIV